MTTPATISIVEYGEDVTWLAARGHHDQAAFLAAADEYARATWGAGGGELPSEWAESKGVEHVYYRAVTREDCRKDAARSYPDRVATAQYRIAEAMFEDRQEEGWVYPCSADHAGAEPWTEVRE